MLVKMSLVEWKVPCSNCKKKKKKIPKLKKSDRVVDEPSKCCCMVITNISPFFCLYFFLSFFSPFFLFPVERAENYIMNYNRCIYVT